LRSGYAHWFKQTTLNGIDSTCPRTRGQAQGEALPVVLIVDDDLAYLEKLQRALRDIYTVHTDDERRRGHPPRSRPCPRSTSSSSTRTCPG
ncbi:MAG: hypothetical protein MZU79_07625, partial [Anaerotruncus sp.]|nr:hypothetical protein [Anaerotruncus sp.]